MMLKYSHVDRARDTLLAIKPDGLMEIIVREKSVERFALSDLVLFPHHLP